MKPQIQRKMKHGKLITSVLLILIGFCAGAGMNLAPTKWFATPGTVHGAPPASGNDPQPALKSVAHDGTLTGDGTTNNPLAIAAGGVRTQHIGNGVVTAPKLSPVAPPSAGQLLGFNGSNLAWQDAPVGGVRVVDSLGHSVGPFVPIRGAIRRLGDIDVVIEVNRNGFQRPDFIGFYHTTPNCSEDRYMDSSTNFLRASQSRGTQVFYADNPIQPATFHSMEQIPVASDPSLPGPCLPTSLSVTAGLVKSFDLSTAGLVPPFHLEF